MSTKNIESKLTMIPRDLVMRFVSDYERCVKSRDIREVEKLQANDVYARYGLFSPARRADLLKRMGIEEKPVKQSAEVELTDEERKFNQHYDICMTCKGMPANVVKNIFDNFDKTFSAPEYSQIYTGLKRKKLMKELGLSGVRA